MTGQLVSQPDSLALSVITRTPLDKSKDITVARKFPFSVATVIVLSPVPGGPETGFGMGDKEGLGLDVGVGCPAEVGVGAASMIGVETGRAVDCGESVGTGEEI